jgi:hypothetical protein
MTIQELDTWFANAKLPEGPLLLYQGTTIHNVQDFVRSHFSVIKNNPNSKLIQPFIDRLHALKSLLESQ